jgi:hypothetical protein
MSEADEETKLTDEKLAGEKFTWKEGDLVLIYEVDARREASGRAHCRAL